MFAKGTKKNIFKKKQFARLVLALKPGPLAPESRIIPLDQQAFMAARLETLNCQSSKSFFPNFFAYDFGNFSSELPYLFKTTTNLLLFF